MGEWAIKTCESKQRKGARYTEHNWLSQRVREAKSERKKEQGNEQETVIKNWKTEIDLPVFH